MKTSVAGAPYASNMKPASTSTRAVPQSCGLPGRERQCQATGTRQGAQQAGVTHLGCAERVQLALCVGQPRAQRPRDVPKHILQPRIRLQQHACRQSAPPGEARQREGRARHREGTHRHSWDRVAHWHAQRLLSPPTGCHLHPLRCLCAQTVLAAAASTADVSKWPPSAGTMSHTIVLVQPTPSKASRTFSDYESVVQALDGVCGMFEKRLKELNPQMRQITYDINDLYRYLDTLHDLSALVFAPGACLPASGWPRGGVGVSPQLGGRASWPVTHTHATQASSPGASRPLPPCTDSAAGGRCPGCVAGCLAGRTGTRCWRCGGCFRSARSHPPVLFSPRSTRRLRASREGLDQAAVLHTPEEAGWREVRGLTALWLCFGTYTPIGWARGHVCRVSRHLSARASAPGAPPARRRSRQPARRRPPRSAPGPPPLRRSPPGRRRSNPAPPGPGAPWP